MRKQLITTAIAAACFVLGAGGATLYTHADTGPEVFEIDENNVTRGRVQGGIAGGDKVRLGQRRRIPRWRLQQDETDAQSRRLGTDLWSSATRTKRLK